MDTRVNYLLLATALLGTFFSGTATRIFTIAMPTLASGLGTDLIGISWALLAYQLSNIGLSEFFGHGLRGQSPAGGLDHGPAYSL